MKFPDKLDVLIAHAILMEETGGRPGLVDEGALESALVAAENRHFYEGADLAACAAAYAFHLTQAHAFFDGNKRIAAAIAETFLESNGNQLTMSDDELVTLFLQIASGVMTRDEVERSIRQHITSA